MNMKNRAERQLSAMAALIGVILASVSLPAMAATPAKQHTVPVTGHKPVVAPVLDNTAPYVGDTITVDPKFSDVDADTEDTTATGTSYQWQVEDTVGSGTFSDIAGATGKTYVPVDADKGKKLIVKVTPRTDPVITEPAVGDEVLSDVATVSTSPASLVNSSLTVTTVQAAYTITAGQQTDTDQNTKATLTLMLKDAATTPNAVKGQTVSFSITPADAGVAVSNVVDNQDGTYTAVLTATKAQQYAITAQVNGAAFGNTLPNLQGSVQTVAAAPDAAHTIVEPFNNLAQAAIAADTQNVGFQTHLFDRFDNVPTWTDTDIQVTVPGFNAANVTTTKDAATNTISVTAGATGAADKVSYIAEKVVLTKSGGQDLLANAELSKLTVVPKITEITYRNINFKASLERGGKQLVLPRPVYNKASWYPVNPSTGQSFSTADLDITSPFDNTAGRNDTSMDVRYPSAPATFKQTVTVKLTDAILYKKDIGSHLSIYRAYYNVPPTSFDVCEVADGDSCGRTGPEWTLVTQIAADDAYILSRDFSTTYITMITPPDRHSSCFVRYWKNGAPNAYTTISSGCGGAVDYGPGPDTWIGGLSRSYYPYQ
ncbi:invasin domain 3-containing protein [Kluyvera ascorbata]|uniref:invasin domain 3-containing protein n=5 Tax=Kluyvera ascorbata TaxID=51288 RepID=UPI000E0463C3|nr:invasin domain 3-containing protein [Kluyvera ascorbata]MDU1198796.1 Ig-like domain-containing protein [Kluyvera ascorbata]BCA38773.1 hypothetical protein KATP_12950 [Kluyvera ascorbata]STW98022.1 Bacterial Ig-like domain (group 1) [Kluyvera ascorbata]